MSLACALCRRDRVAEAFGFERGDEAFGQRVVVGIAGPAHAGGDAV